MADLPGLGTEDRRSDPPGPAGPGAARLAPAPVGRRRGGLRRICLTAGTRRKPRHSSGSGEAGFSSSGFNPFCIAFLVASASNVGMREKKVSTTYRLSETALKLLLKLAERGGTTRTAVLEALIRKAAKEQKIRD